MMHAPLSAAAEVTIFTKTRGPLTKHISLKVDGTLANDSSACTMARGMARRSSSLTLNDLARLIENLKSNQAIALGSLRSDLPDEVGVATKESLNSHEQPGVISRTSSNIAYRRDQAAFVLHDYDVKGMPADVAERITSLGGFWNALALVAPMLAGAARVERKSTSAGLMRADTGEQLTGSGGLHDYIVVKDGSDAQRYLADLHARCWLAGFGWMMVGAAGQLLERSIVDRSVGLPERLVFEGAPVVEPPLVQDVGSRRAVIAEGEVIDTVAACKPLTLVEKQALKKLLAEASQRLLPESNKARQHWIGAKASEIVTRTGMSREEAVSIAERCCKGTLLAAVTLPFDDDEIGCVSVADVLDDPERFDGLTMADPIEGVEYGRCKAKVMRGSDGAPWISSFAHGGAAYQLRYDYEAARVRIERSGDAVKALVKIVLVSDLDAAELKRLVDNVARRSSLGTRVVEATVKAAKKKHAERRAEEMKQRELASRSDPRVQMAQPAKDAPFSPQMEILEEVLGRSTADQPPGRDIEGCVARAAKIAIPGTHEFTADDANAEGEEET